MDDRRRARLVERRRALGLTQEALAARCDVGRTTVARWETGAMEPGLWVRARLADALEIPLTGIDELLAPGPAQAQLVITETLPSEQERTEAHGLLSHLAAITLTDLDTPDPAWTEPVERLTAPAPARIGSIDVDHVRALTAAMRAVDYAHGGGACRDAIAAQVRWTQQLLTADATDDVRRDLLVALADLHNLAGWASFDVGMFTTARRHFARALEQARLAGADSLCANIFYRLGRLHLHRGLGAEALKFFHLGQLVTQGRYPVTDAMLWVNAAWAHAVLDNAQQMERAITQAFDAYDDATTDPTHTWVEFFGEADLNASTGVTLTSLPSAVDHEMSRAIKHITAAVDRRGTDMARSRTFEHTALAVAHLRVGATEEGIEHGHCAIDGAASVRSVRTVDRLEPLRLEAAERNSTDAHELVHRISELSTTTSGS